MGSKFQIDHDSDISTDGESSSQSLCKACGFCCDGTLFRNAKIGPDEDVIDLEKRGIKTICDNEIKFAMPCAVFDKVCTIYHMDRPNVCDKYKCKLLIRHNNGELSYDDALTIISNAKIHKEEVEAQFTALCGSNEGLLIDRYRNVLKQQAEMRSKEQAAAMVNFAAFKLRLERHFMKPKK